jgi:CRP-like cAMP-binding protein
LKAVRAHPVAELLECPTAIGLLLNGAARNIHCTAGEVVFRQMEPSRGLYLVISGRFERQADRLQTKLTLATARPGDLVELAAALGDGRHTYTLTAQTAGSLLLLPNQALQEAWKGYLPLRMRLLEELAREVSRAYYSCALGRAVRSRQGSSAA